MTGRIDPANPPKWAGFARRLFYLCFGLALGFVILGLFQMAKQHQARVDEEHRRELLSRPEPNDGLFPPVPKAEPAAQPGQTGSNTPSPQSSK